MDANRLEEESRLLLHAEDNLNPSSKKGTSRWILLLLALSALTCGAYYAWGHWVKPAAAAATAGQTEGRGARGGRARGGVGPRGATVVTIAARRANMPVYL